MAFLELYRDRLKHNYQYLSKLFEDRDIEWGVVTKLLCGNKDYIREVINLGAREIHDSRISNLKVVKSIDSKVQTVYIKPPAKRSIRNLIRYADVSFNSSYSTIKLLSEEAGRQNKKHKIIIMIEMGDLREGVLGENVIDFYERIFELPNIEVTGIGTNLNCLHGVMPSQDKLIQLSLYKQLIEAKFNRKIPWVSGGTSVTIPLLLKKMRPMGINHFRVGEILYFGLNLFTMKTVKGMRDDVFKLYTEIIELYEKPKVPMGELAENPSGEVMVINEEDYGKTSYRAIIDVGLLDISPEFLIPDDPKIEISGASSDMLVIDLGKTRRNYKVGDLVSFKLRYMGALSILNSDYIDKKII
ncbi:alanine/ornithine racemase family PLP-dependent enzyme [Fulvivirga sp. 29W222]|uniref:Alanine/ornithine racemase family PLP-dependent enzyme n=1 Tax=Fulvivirga marina TaxID=2494733 RepID=A0A937FZN3_9BACT|nr:alanine/ornithine racemase family PLP-dependent enzyme [Fulvivirga marina]MBL6448979.1 alanine/ornithine racemase family PLP-dependent enzyme [Fulvivirga marina]